MSHPRRYSPKRPNNPYRPFPFKDHGPNDNRRSMIQNSGPSLDSDEDEGVQMN